MVYSLEIESEYGALLTGKVKCKKDGCVSIQGVRTVPGGNDGTKQPFRLTSLPSTSHPFDGSLMLFDGFFKDHDQSVDEKGVAIRFWHGNDCLFVQGRGKNELGE